LMKTASIREVKAKLSEYVELAKTDLVVITRHGRAAAVLQAIEPEDLEEVLYETSDRFRSLIESRRSSAGRRLVPLEAVPARPPARKTVPSSRRAPGR
jgi:prevent-host-death family protein